MIASLDEGRKAAPGSQPRGAAWRGALGAAFAALVAAGLTLAPAPASAADQPTPSGSQANDPRSRVSPYARFAREHQQLVGRKPGQGRPAMRSVGHAPRAAGHTRR